MQSVGVSRFELEALLARMEHDKVEALQVPGLLKAVSAATRTHSPLESAVLRAFGAAMLQAGAVDYHAPPRAAEAVAAHLGGASAVRSPPDSPSLALPAVSGLNQRSRCRSSPGRTSFARRFSRDKLAGHDRAERAEQSASPVSASSPSTERRPSAAGSLLRRRSSSKGPPEPPKHDKADGTPPLGRRQRVAADAGGGAADGATS